MFVVSFLHLGCKYTLQQYVLHANFCFFYYRWFKHISSYTNEVNSLPGVVKSLEQLGFGICDGKEKDKTTQDDDDDDDIDLFGSDDEADSEAEKIKEQRLKVRKEFFNGRDIFQFRFQ